MSHWTDNIPEDWGIETLDKSVSNVVDNRGRTAPTAESGIPLIATNCIKEHGLYPVYEKLRYIDDDTYNNWFRGHPKPNDILFVNKGTPGGVCVVPDPVPFCIAQDMVALRADPKKFDWKYLFAALRSTFVRSQIEALNVGTSIPHLKKTDFNRIVIPKPTLKDQIVIGEIYFSLNKKIELNLQMNKTLEAMAMALYKHWFVDFGPFQNGDFVDSELGMIPKGWEVKRLEEEFNITIGRTPPRKEPKWFSTDSGVKWVSIKDMGNCGVYIFNTSEFLTETAVKSKNVPLIPENTVILSFKLTVGRVCISTEKMVSNEAIAHFVQTKKTIVSSEFLYLALKVFDYNSLGSTSSIATAVNSKTVKAMRVIVPSKTIAEQFQKEVSNLFELIKSNSLEMESLTKLRDILLPKLISGEVRVQELQQTITNLL